MRFIDSNVFVHAFLKPRRRLEAHEAEIKEGAKRIVAGLEEGEEAITTVVHVSEVANILESRASQEESLEILEAIVSLRSLSITGVTSEMYKAAVLASELMNLGVNDTLAYHIMKDGKMDEIYSFDKHFDKLKDIKRLTNSRS
jgi:hypothetical protein